MDTIKIASFFRSMEIGFSGGAGKIHATVGKILSELGYDVYYLQMEDGSPRYDHKGTIINLNEKFYLGFGIKKIFSRFRLAWKISRRCNQNDIKIILGQGDFFFMVVGLSKLFGNRSKCIGYVHTTISIRPWYIRFVIKRMLRFCDYIIFTSREEKERFENEYDFSVSNNFLLYNPIDIKSILEKSSEEIDKELEYIFDKKIFTFITVARYSYQKNLQLLVASFDKIWQENNMVQLVIIGDGEEKEEIQKIVSSLSSKNSIYLLGNQSNPHKFLKKSDCFVLSSRFEGFPMVLIEACVQGLPIVSLDCPTGPREVIGCGEGGILCDFTIGSEEKNLESLKNGMIEIQKFSLEEIENISKRNKIYSKQFDIFALKDQRKQVIPKILK